MDGGVLYHDTVRVKNVTISAEKEGHRARRGRLRHACASGGAGVRSVSKNTLGLDDSTEDPLRQCEILAGQDFGAEMGVFGPYTPTRNSSVLSSAMRVKSSATMSTFLPSTSRNVHLGSLATHSAVTSASRRGQPCACHSASPGIRAMHGGNKRHEPSTKNTQPCKKCVASSQTRCVRVARRCSCARRCTSCQTGSALLIPQRDLQLKALLLLQKEWQRFSTREFRRRI